MFSSAGGGGGGEDTYTEAEVSGGGTTAAGGDVGKGKGGGIMLFGVRLMEEGTFRKSASMNNLALFEEHPHESNVDAANPGYASDDVVHPSARSRERKRGVPWTEEEHKLFLIGLQKVGKGDWRGISRNFVKTRTPTQVASHAQKYFLRRNNSNRRRRRSSLFDITTDAVIRGSGTAAFEEGIQQESMQQQNLINNLENYHMSTLTPAISPATGISPMEGLVKGQKGQLKSTSPKFIRPIPVIPIPPSSKLANLSLNNTTKKSIMKDPSPLSLKISSLPSSSSSSSPSSPEKQAPRHTSAFQAMPSNSFDSSGGDSIISVA